MPTLPVFVLNNLASGVASVIPDADPRRPADIEPRRVYGRMLDGTEDRGPLSAGTVDDIETLLWTNWMASLDGGTETSATIGASRIENRTAFKFYDEGITPAVVSP
mgnify:CR=1 FL=1